MAKVIHESKKVERACLLKLARNTEEEKLVKQIIVHRHLKTLLELKAVKEDVKYLLQYPAEFSFDSVFQNQPEVLNSQTKKKQWNALIRNVFQFFKKAEERNNTFVDQVLEELEATEDEATVLLAGGYHTEGLTEILRGKGVSYMVVTPNLTEVKADLPYIEQMMGIRGPMDQLLEASFSTLATISRIAPILGLLGTEEATTLQKLTHDYFSAVGFGLAAADLAEGQESTVDYVRSIVALKKKVAAYASELKSQGYGSVLGETFQELDVLATMAIFNQSFVTISQGDYRITLDVKQLTGSQELNITQQDIAADVVRLV